MPDLASPRFKADPHPFYAHLRAENPVYRTRLAFWLPVWLVVRYDDVLTVLRDERFAKEFSHRLPWTPRSLRPLTRNTLINLDPPDHTRLRALVSKVFTPRIVEQLGERVQGLCDRLLDAASDARRIDLVDELGLPLPLTIIADLLGVPRQDRKRFDDWSRRLGAATSGALPDVLRALPYMWRFVRYCRRLIALRRSDPGDDLVTELIRVEQAGDRLSEDELVGMIYLLLVGGYETTAQLIACGALALIEHPEQRKRFVENPDLAGTAIEELLRYTSPADVATPRIARENVPLGSVTVPRGAFLLPALGSANRDASRFPDPDTLDLGREPNRHLAFGSGAHFCIGAALARLEGRIALSTLFSRFPDLRLAIDSRSLRWRRGLGIRGLESLPLELGPRKRGS